MEEERNNRYFNKKYEDYVASRKAFWGLSIPERIWKSLPALSVFEQWFQEKWRAYTGKGKALLSIATILILIPALVLSPFVFLYKKCQDQKSTSQKLVFILFVAFLILTFLAMQLAMIPTLPASIALGLALTGMISHFSLGVVNTLLDGVSSVLFLGMDLLATDKELSADEKLYRRWSAFPRLFFLAAGITLGAIFIAPLAPALITVSLPAWATFLVIFIKITLPVAIGLIFSGLVGFLGDYVIGKACLSKETIDNAVAENTSKATRSSSEHSLAYDRSRSSNDALSGKTSLDVKHSEDFSKGKRSDPAEGVSTKTALAAVEKSRRASIHESFLDENDVCEGRKDGHDVVSSSQRAGFSFGN